MEQHIKRYWRDLARLAQRIPAETINLFATEFLACRVRGGTIFIVGNGGSAATASHFACDLAKGTRTNGLPTFRVMPLTDNVPLMTAWGNDTSYERIFAEQLVALVRPADVVVLISASGNSPNILAAARVATAAGAITLALTGQTGGQLASLADITLCVPSPSIEQVEDIHLAIAHTLCVALREHLRAELEAAVLPTQPAPEPLIALELGAPLVARPKRLR